jgi:ectoine hydroxylase-related dioxygenase (phytanoyl-CoA dioxygenase family)
MPRSSFNLWNSDFWKVQVKNNTIVLFPSSLYHSVEKNVNDCERVSIAFNVFARGEFGTDEGLTYLKLQ